MIVQHVILNKYSRAGLKRKSTKGIVIHWTANPGGSDTAHQKFFDGKDGGGSRYAGAHIFIDSDSETEVIPLNEVAYHANEKKCLLPSKLGTNANFTTIGVEMCVEKDGTISPATVVRTIRVVADLCKKYKLTSDQIYRHFDVTGKPCPRPWVEDAMQFSRFKASVNKKLKG